MPFLSFCNDTELFKVFPANSLTKIRPDGSNINYSATGNDVFIDAAKDEAQSFQLVVVSNGKKLKNLKVEIDNFPGNISLEWRKVEWVKTGNPSYPTEYVGLWPDPLLKCDSFDLSPDLVQPLWFTVKVPAGGKAGLHIARVTVSGNSYKKRFNIRVKVRDFVLPRTLAAPFGLYAWKLSEWYYGTKKYREVLKIEDYMVWANFLMNYRLNPKEIGQEYSEKTKDGLVDLSPLTKTMGAMAKKLPPYSYSLFRLPSGFTVEKWFKTKKVEKIVDDVTNPALNYWNAWKKQKFPEQVYIYGIDEPAGNPELHAALEKMYARLKKNVPQLKIMQTCAGPVPHLADLVDIWCPKNVKAWSPFFQEQIKKGDILWNYVCVSPIAPYPNFFIDTPAIEHRILFWQTSKINSTGFLYWSVGWYDGFNSAASGKPCFPDVRLDYSKHCQYTSSWVNVNGDGLLVYPGKNLKPVPSIRLEVIREGIQDYEYIALLKKLTEKVAAIPVYQTPAGITLVKAARKLAIVPDNITSGPAKFTYDSKLILERRSQIGDMIEQLQNVLHEKSYKTWSTYTKTVKPKVIKDKFSYELQNPASWKFNTYWRWDNGVISGGNAGIVFLTPQNKTACKDMEFEANVTPTKTEGNSWKGLALTICKSNKEYWAIALMEKPDHAGKGHFIELKEKWASKWGAETNLKRLISKNENFNWEYGKTYKLKLKISKSRIDGMVLDKMGKILSHVAFELKDGKSVTSGFPAIWSRAMKGNFTNIKALGNNKK